MNSHFWDSINKLPKKELALYIGLAVIFTALINSVIELSSGYMLIQQQNSQADNVRAVKTTTKPSYSSKDIIEGALFGQSNTTKRLSEIKLPVTKLQLILRGAFTATTPENASAIIEGSNKKAKHYNIGQTVFGQTQLKAVYSDRVILTNNGKLETLYFPKTNTSNTKTTVQKLANTQQTTNVNDQQRQALIKKRLEELRNRSKR